MIIDFSPDGTVEAMHRDDFPLGFLGPQSVQRASDIRFNEETQLWDLYIRHGGSEQAGFVVLHDAQCGFPGYDTARKVEVEWLDQCRLSGIMPLSAAGIGALLLIRHNHGIPCGSTL